MVDAPSKKGARIRRAGAVNLVPAITGAAIATTKVLPQLEGKFDGIATRTPVPFGSISDITFAAARNTSAEEVNNINKRIKTDKYKLVLSASSHCIFRYYSEFFCFNC